MILSVCIVIISALSDPFLNMLLLYSTYWFLILSSQDILYQLLKGIFFLFAYMYFRNWVKIQLSLAWPLLVLWTCAWVLKRFSSKISNSSQVDFFVNCDYNLPYDNLIIDLTHSNVLVMLLGISRHTFLCCVGATLWHLQRFLQYIKYVILDFIYSIILFILPSHIPGMFPFT
jgi:hypothetical protein